MVSVEKKAGKGTYFASYGIKDEAALLSYNHKPFKVGGGCPAALLQLLLGRLLAAAPWCPFMFAATSPTPRMLPLLAPPSLPPSLVPRRSCCAARRARAASRA